MDQEGVDVGDERDWVTLIDMMDPWSIYRHYLSFVMFFSSGTASFHISGLAILIQNVDHVPLAQLMISGSVF